MCIGCGLAYSRQALFPDVVEEDGGFDVAEAVFGDFAVASFGEHGVDVAAGDAMCFGGFDAEGFAIKIEVESARRAFASADVVEGQLFGEVAVRFGLVTVTEPIFARDGNVEESRTEIDEGNIEAASVECDDGLESFGDVPEVGEKVGFVDAGNEFDGRGFSGVFFEVGRGEEDLAAGSFGIQHGDADDLGGERPEAALLADFSAARVAGDFVGDAFAFTEEVFLLDFVEVLEWESGGFDVENEFGHCAGSFVAEEEEVEQEETEGTERKD